MTETDGEQMVVPAWQTLYVKVPFAFMGSLSVVEPEFGTVERSEPLR